MSDQQFLDNQFSYNVCLTYPYEYICGLCPHCINKSNRVLLLGDRITGKEDNDKRILFQITDINKFYNKNLEDVQEMMESNRRGRRRFERKESPERKESSERENPKSKYRKKKQSPKIRQRRRRKTKTSSEERSELGTTSHE